MHRSASSVALLAGLLIAGAICGAGLQRWMGGGLGRQHAQLEQCILASRHAHPNEAARSTLTRLEAEVPNCMVAAGYETALGNENCGSHMWQGDVFCYLPKSFLGKLVYRIEASAQKKRTGDEGKTQPLREG
jgi:hypothetical protein